MNPPTSTGDEVNLCKGCGTMKHLNTEGYCGRCQSDIRSRYPLNTFSREVQDEIIALFESIESERVRDKKAIKGDKNHVVADSNMVSDELRSKIANIKSEDFDGDGYLKHCTLEDKIGFEVIDSIMRLITTHTADIERAARTSELSKNIVWDGSNVGGITMSRQEVNDRIKALNEPDRSKK